MRKDRKEKKMSQKSASKRARRHCYVPLAPGGYKRGILPPST